MPNCLVRLLGLTPYDEAWHLQERLAGEIAAGNQPPTLLLLEHPHVYTLGRRALNEHLLWDEDLRAQKEVAVRWVDRGGDITYHGPGQLVGYPLIPLAPLGWQERRLPEADFVGYVRKLEKVIIGTLANFGLAAIQREGLTGVWVAAEEIKRCRPTAFPNQNFPAKIASIGVKIDVHGISRHGFALNVAPDMSFWQGIVPCGLDGVTMISMAELLQPVPRMDLVIQAVSEVFGRVFGYQMVKANLKN
jgi:lipoyl(octanoyl) transferase